MTRLLAAALPLLLCAGLAACGSSDTKVVNRLVSPQQERADLQRALAMGAISQSEYDAQMRKLGSR